MVLYATFNNISVISWWSVLLMDEIGVPGKKTNLSEVTDTLYYIMMYRIHLTTNGVQEMHSQDLTM
jgi:hypothetical protein